MLLLMECTTYHSFEVIKRSSLLTTPSLKHSCIALPISAFIHVHISTIDASIALLDGDFNSSFNLPRYDDRLPCTAKIKEAI